MQSFDGFQGAVATHTDQQHIHNHLVMNSVNWKTGLKWQQSRKDLQELKDLSDRFCKEYGLSIVEKAKTGRVMVSIRQFVRAEVGSRTW